MVALFTLASGCGLRPKRVYAAHGKVVDARQKPAAGATVILHPLGAADPAVPKPTGTVNEAGEFVLTTYKEGDGAPEGEYAVTVIWLTCRVLTFDPEETDRLKGRYDHPDRSPLPHVTISKPGPNELPTIVLQ